MRLIWFSTSPHIGVGYGVATKELVPRMIADGHQVKVATKHHLGGQLIINGIECFDGGELGVVNEVAKKEGYDYIISGNDIWAFSAYNVLNKCFDKNLWAAAIYLDTEWIHPHMINAAKEAKFQIAVTKHGEKELKRVGFNPIYAPLGVNTKQFKPDEELRKTFRKKKGWEEDTFVVGFVGINYPTDRKNIIGLIKAFQMFHNKHPKSELYLHTDTIGSSTNGLPINWVMGACGFDSEGKGAIKVVNQVDYHLWNISQDELIGLYNAFDVFCFPTQGEGFGLPIVEAQACGCPVITTETTSGKELLKSGSLIKAKEDYYEFSTLKTWYMRVPPSEIYKHLEKMYKVWQTGKIEKYRKAARKGIMEYDWDNVYDKYWRPLLKTLEEAKHPASVQTMQPDWRYLHSQMIGRIMFRGKFDCGQFECKETCKWDFPKLGEEQENDRLILSRSYPIFPNKTGELMVDTKCKFSKWLSPNFVDEVKILWEELWSYPRIREQIIDLWDSGFFDKGVFVPLDSITYEFDDTYAEIMQRYFTTFKITDNLLDKVKESGLKILDIGCGEGKRVKELREKGFEAIGTEINKHWIDNKIIFEGNAEKLPFKDNEFDAVVSIDVLEHLKNPLVAIKELFRVCKTYAIIEVTTSSDVSIKEDPTHITRWSPPQWEREFSEYGTIEEKITGQAWLIKKK